MRDDLTQPAQLKLRLLEADRAALADAAQRHGVSLNTEIVDRLRRSLAADEVRQAIREEIAELRRS
jgi:hypothetical protein